ncbi:hypothetical protein TIFTF001_020233 [Ficus carica]|uniref:Uncharacterized protein n=1 Tax=Ficus carica TaxID=3494 RepID=A0AA88ARD5_FICCA|nr:hypothetical protein TIFTF001_020233 [Ficus carica]
MLRWHHPAPKSEVRRACEKCNAATIPLPTDPTHAIIGATVHVPPSDQSSRLTDQAVESTPSVGESNRFRIAGR